MQDVHVHVTAGAGLDTCVNLRGSICHVMLSWQCEQAIQRCLLTQCTSVVSLASVASAKLPCTKAKASHLLQLPSTVIYVYYSLATNVFMSIHALLTQEWGLQGESEGFTALMWACHELNDDAVQLLLSCGASVADSDKKVNLAKCDCHAPASLPRTKQILMQLCALLSLQCSGTLGPWFCYWLLPSWLLSQYSARSQSCSDGTAALRLPRLPASHIYRQPAFGASRL